MTQTAEFRATVSPAVIPLHVMTDALESALYHIELGFPGSHDVLKTKIRKALELAKWSEGGRARHDRNTATALAVTQSQYRDRSPSSP